MISFNVKVLGNFFLKFAKAVSNFEKGVLNYFFIVLILKKIISFSRIAFVLFSKIASFLYFIMELPY